MAKSVLTNFKGLVGKPSRELVPDNQCIDIENFDFNFPGSLNLRKGTEVCITGLGTIQGLKRFYGSGGLRNLLIADDDNLYEGNISSCTSSLISKYDTGFASTVDATDTVTFSLESTNTGDFVNFGTIEATPIDSGMAEDIQDNDDVVVTLFSDSPVPGSPEALAGYQVNGTEFSSQIPDGASIDGIEITIRARKTTSDTLDPERVIMSKPASEGLGTFVADTMTLTETLTTFTFGGAADTFGKSWIKSDFSATNFFQFRGVWKKDGADSVQIEVDYIAIKIYYSAGTGDPNITKNVEAGDLFEIVSDAVLYEIESVDSDTQVTLTTNFSGTFTDEAYRIHKPKNNSNKISSALFQSKDRLYIANGNDEPMEWNGVGNVQDIGLAAPSGGAAAEGGAGNIPDGTYQYKYTLVSEFGESDPSAAFSVTVSGGPSQVDLTSIARGPEKVTARNIYRTAVSGTSFFFLDSIDDNITTTFTDDITDAVLVTNESLFTASHAQPPVLKGVEVHKNHLFGFAKNSNSLRFSIQDFPDHWPATNEIKTTSGQTIKSINSLGDVLVIYTQVGIELLLGDDVDNFQLVEIESSFGLTSQFSVTKVPGNSHFYLSQSGVRRFSGRSSPRVSDSIERVLFDENSKLRINKNQLSKICSLYAADRFYMAYPRANDNQNSRLLVWDFLTQDWFIYKLEATAIESFDGVGDSNELIIGNSSGEVVEINKNNVDIDASDNETNITAKWRSRYSELGSHEIKRFDNVFIKVFSEGNTQVTLFVRTNTNKEASKTFETKLSDHALEFLFELPNDFIGTEIQYELQAKGQNPVRVERLITEFEVQREDANKKDT